MGVALSEVTAGRQPSVGEPAADRHEAAAAAGAVLPMDFVRMDERDLAADAASPPTNSGPHGHAANEGFWEMRFRRYRLLPGSRLLVRDGQPVEMGGRTLDLLQVLLSERGRGVDKPGF